MAVTIICKGKKFHADYFTILVLKQFVKKYRIGNYFLVTHFSWKKQPGRKQ